MQSTKILSDDEITKGIFESNMEFDLQGISISQVVKDIPEKREILATAPCPQPTINTTSKILNPDKPGWYFRVPWDPPFHYSIYGCAGKHSTGFEGFMFLSYQNFIAAENAKKKQKRKWYKKLNPLNIITDVFLTPMAVGSVFQPYARGNTYGTTVSSIKPAVRLLITIYRTHRTRNSQDSFKLRKINPYAWHLETASAINTKDSMGIIIWRDEWCYYPPNKK